MIIRADDNDSVVLGEESLPIIDPDVREFAGWRIALGGRPHPRVCGRCGTILKRLPIPPFRLRKRHLDFSVSRDGYYIVSSPLFEFMRANLRVESATPAPGERGFLVLDHEALPVVEVDRTASGTIESRRCGSCDNPYYQLLGRMPGRPPTIRRLSFLREPSEGQLSRSDMAFGTTHGRAPALVAPSSLEERLRARSFKGMHLWARISDGPADQRPRGAPDNNAMNLTNREVPGMKERRPSGEPEHG